MSDKTKSSPRKSPSRLELIAGGLFIIGLFVFAGVNIVETILDYLTRDSWVETTATVVKINSKTHWLTYQYEVAGEDYIGTRLTLTGDGDSEWGIPPEAANYPEGMELTVFYDPDRPWRVAISPTADFTEYIALGLLIIGIIIGYFALKRLLYRYLKFVGDMLSGNMWKDQS